MASPFQPPAFWWQAPSGRSALLSPLSFLYGALAARNLRRGKREDVGVPVLCVGNPTVGGAGKTPTAMALAEAAMNLGRRPGFVSRGYGRKEGGTTIVDARKHSVLDVGDEPLLLASLAPTAVGTDRAEAARLLVREGNCDFIVMDDGFQSARILTDYVLLVADARRGFGNWRVFPSGPLRAPILDQFAFASSVLLVGEGEAGRAVVSEAARANLATRRGRFMPDDGGRFRDLRVLAFAGIADPGKFLASLEACGARIEDSRAFPDHHAFTAENIKHLSERAWRQGLQLVTTTKDAIRLATGDASARHFLEECEVLEIGLVFEGAEDAAGIVRQTLANFHKRRYGA